jgi:imidazolonepropionase-like amidohydrolase
MSICPNTTHDGQGRPDSLNSRLRELARTIDEWKGLLTLPSSWIVLLACSIAQLSAQPAAQALRYSIVINGRAAGSEVDTYHPDGRIDTTFEYNDRGRGPKIEGHYLLGTDAKPIRVDLHGLLSSLIPVDEHFVVQGDRATWKSTSEEGAAPKGAFYVSRNGPWAERAALVAALVKAKGALTLLPSGQARLEKLAEATLENRGSKVHVTEFGVSGLSFDLQTIWLDDDLHFFADPGKLISIMREGWESANQQLYDLQTKAEDERYARLAHDLARHPHRPVAVEHVRLFDSEQAVMRNDWTVVIDANQFAQVGPAATTKVPAGAEHIDGSGKTLLPALFDMHVHSSPNQGLLDVASGVTSTRDMGNDIEALQHLQQKWDSGEAIGPRIWKAGFIDGRGPFQAPHDLYADTPEEAQAAVSRYAGLGYIQIKLYSSLKPELVPGIVKAAHERGLRVSGHVPNGMTARQFVEEGADELQHINFIFLNFIASQVKDTRTTERFTAVAANAAKLDLNSKEVADFIDLLKARHTTVDVTLGVFEGMFTARPKKVSPHLASIVERLPAQMQRGAYSGGLPVTESNDQSYLDSYEAMLQMTKRMYDAGIPILAGTDSTAPGIMLHRELELEVRAGIPPEKALQIATYNAARLLKQEKQLGSIAPGKQADFVLVEGNPAENIGDIRRCRLVMKNGTLYKSDELYDALGIKPAN